MIAPLLAACLANAPLPGAAAPVGAAQPAQIAPLPLAGLDETLDVTGQTLAAREVSDRLTIAVEVNGAGPFRFMVDTGADASVIGLNLAATLGLRAQRCIRLHGTAGATLVPAVSIDSLRVGGRVIEHLSAPVLPEVALDADGVVGIDALAGQRVRLDFVARTITMEDAKRREMPAPTMAGDIVVTARRQRGQLILAAGSSAGVAILAVIDTGANLSVGNGALRRRIFGQRQQPDAQPVNLISVTGQTVVADLVIVPELTIGTLTLRNVPIAFADAPPFALFGLADTPAVLLGTDVLQAFSRVTLDFRRHKVRFALRTPDRAPGRDGR